MVNGVSESVGNGGILNHRDAGQARSGGGTFSRVLDQVLEKTAENLDKADQAAVQANAGGPVALHDVMIAMEKADISLRLLVQVRNKVLEAYQEVMRMQV